MSFKIGYKIQQQQQLVEENTTYRIRYWELISKRILKQSSKLLTTSLSTTVTTSEFEPIDICVSFVEWLVL